jgi:hypothetical protein
MHALGEARKAVYSLLAVTLLRRERKKKGGMKSKRTVVLLSGKDGGTRHRHSELLVTVIAIPTAFHSALSMANVRLNQMYIGLTTVLSNLTVWQRCQKKKKKKKERWMFGRVALSDSIVKWFYGIDNQGRRFL